MRSTSHTTERMKLRPNNPPAIARRPPTAAIIAMATSRKIRAVTAKGRLARAASIVPFHLDADLAVGIGADIAFDLGMLEDLPLDHAAARIGRSALSRADIDPGRDVAAALDRGRGALVAARAAATGVDRQLVEAEAAAQLGHEAAAHRLLAG